MCRGLTTLDELVRVLGERDSGRGFRRAIGPRGRPQRPPGTERSPGDCCRAETARSDAPRVLAADDDPQMRRLVRTVLVREGIQVFEAADGLDAIELAAQVTRAEIPVIGLTAVGDETRDEGAGPRSPGLSDQTGPPHPRVREVLRRVKA